MTKSQKETALLGTLVVAILGVLGYYLVQSGKEEAAAPYQAKSISTQIPDGLFKHPQYPRLTSPVKLPLEPGTTGNSDPFGVKTEEKREEKK